MKKINCYCQCHALDNFGWSKDTLKCEHCFQGRAKWSKDMKFFVGDLLKRPNLNFTDKDKFLVDWLVDYLTLEHQMFIEAILSHLPKRGWGIITFGELKKYLKSIEEIQRGQDK